MKGSWLFIGVGVALVMAGGAAAAAPMAAATSQAVTTAQVQRSGDGPAGFWWGTDSWPVPVPGSAPYTMPYLGGAYGGYIGMAGNWAQWLGYKGGFIAWSPANAAQARVNYTKYHKGVGVGAYWYMGGPGVDTRYNGTAAGAYAWGARQAAQALSGIARDGGINYPVVWADIELPGIKPALDNGWNSVYTSPLSGIVKQYHIPAAIDRAEFNGFANYITSHSRYKVGVYSSPGVWTSIFGTGTASLIPNTYEWTYQPETAHLGNAPYGWRLNHGSGAYAQFFGGQTCASKYALMWQWSGGGGVRNGVGDFDQIDSTRLP